MNARRRFWRTTPIVSRATPINSATPRGSSRRRIASALAAASAVPLPIATPIPAAESAPASLIPSPIIITVEAPRAAIAADFDSGV